MPSTSAARLRGAELDWFRDGPLGTQNYRRQLGRSFVLCSAAQKDRVTLVYTGATQNAPEGQLRKGLDLRAEGDAAASLVQVSCTYEGQNAENAERPLQVRGTIAWGTDGHQCSAEFDWNNGTILQVAASFVKVSARIVDNLTATDLVPTHNADAAVQVGATIGYWASARLAPTLTQQGRLDGTVEAPVVVFPIPRFARRLWIGLSTPEATFGDAQWALGAAAGQEFAVIDTVANISSRTPYERPGPATHVVLTGTLGQVFLTTLTWELVL